MSDNDNGFEAPVETTSVFREEIIKEELNQSSAPSSEPAKPSTAPRCAGRSVSSSTYPPSLPTCATHTRARPRAFAG